MQNAQNNFTVETLVAKYRNYVNEHCPKWRDDLIGDDGEVIEYVHPDSPDANVDEQLIVTLYKKVSGCNADTRVLDALSQYSEVFYDKALTEDEMSFLCEHFSEVVSYEFAHRKEWFQGNTGLHISEERIRLVKEYVKPHKGERIFIADTEYCDLAVLFPDCIISGFTGMNYEQKKVWALGQIRLFAAGIQSEIVSGEEVNDEYSYTLPAKGSVDVVFFRVNENKYFAQKIFGTECKDIEALYDLLKPNGIMLFFSEFISDLAGNKADKYEAPVFDFRIRRTKEKAISSIVAYEDKGAFGNKYFMLALRKAENNDVYIKDEVKSRSKYINADELDPEILWPTYYWVNRPTNGIQLSSIIRLYDGKLFQEKELAEFIKGTGWQLHEKAKSMPLVLPALLGNSYKDANLWNKSFSNVGDPAFEEEWVRFGIAKEPSVLLNGSTEDLRVGYTTKVPDGGLAYMKGCCLVPQAGIDVRYIASLLFEPSVKTQILTICDGYFDNRTLSMVVDKIIVPNHDEKERLTFLVDSSNQAISDLRKERERIIEEKLSTMKADYINEVRMRKHDIRPYLRQLASCERLMHHYIENASGIDDLKEDLKNQLKYSHVALDCISTIVDHLSDEERFGEPEIVNIDEYLAGIQIDHDEIEGLKIEYNRNLEAFKNAGFAIPDFWEQKQLSEEKKKQITEEEEKEKKEKKDVPNKSIDNLPLFISISPVDLQRLVTNIIENARKHGFTDKTRTDYYIGINLTIDVKQNLYQIDFSNNGNPLPDGMDKEHFGLRGVKAGITGGTGNGGYIIKTIVTHYGGDYDVFTENNITTIRVYLPITRI